MSALKHPIINLDALKTAGFSHGESFGAESSRIGPQIGMKQLGCSIFIVPPGKRAGPFHNHHAIEEAMVILAGEGEYRFGEDTHPVRAGDVVTAPAGGQDTAHQLINTGVKELKYLCFSTKPKVDVVEYPDSGKVGADVFENPAEGTAPFVHRAHAQEIDYWEGEE